MPINHEQTRMTKAIISNPKPGDYQSLRLLAWAALKSSRNQTINQTRLNQLARKVAA